MHWILEDNITDFGYQWLIKVLERYEIKYTLVKVVPYEDILIDPKFDTFERQPNENDNIVIENNTPIFPFGTMGLSRIAGERNWKSGALTNDEFTFEKWSSGFGLENLLNSESKIMAFCDVLEFQDSMFFARPCMDNKSFSGQVITRTQFLEWQKTILDINDPLSKLNKDTMITIAPFKNIMTEARMFIFEGKVVTGSYYKFGCEVRYEEVKNGDPVIDYTNDIVKDYQPAKAFVIDIALTDDGYKIIEINGINSVGLYNADVDKFVQAVMLTFGEK
jgi:hypothetical protein